MNSDPRECTGQPTSEHACYVCCDRCNHDAHWCQQCGDSIDHGRTECEDCS